MILFVYFIYYTNKMDQPKSRKGKDGLKKDQKIKAHADRLGSAKHIRMKEQMMLNKNKK